jgi:alpha-L-arabinofuranosidase
VVTAEGYHPDTLHQRLVPFDATAPVQEGPIYLGKECERGDSGACDLSGVYAGYYHLSGSRVGIPVACSFHSTLRLVQNGGTVQGTVSTDRYQRGCDAGSSYIHWGQGSWAVSGTVERDRIVLERLGGLADHVSLHRYVGNPSGDLADYLAVTTEVSEQIEAVDATARYVRAARKGRKRAFLSFDEWNVWYRTQRREHMDGGWRQAPELIEEVYDLADALVVAGFLHTFLRYADVVKIANLAQITNVIAPVLTKPDGLLVQSIYHPFAMVSARRDGTSLRTAVRGPTYETTRHGSVPYVEASAVLGPDRLHVFVTNRTPDAAAPVSVELAGPGGQVADVIDADILTGPGPDAANSWEEPDTVKAHALAAPPIHSATGRRRCDRGCMPVEASQRLVADLEPPAEERGGGRGGPRRRWIARAGGA